MSVGVPEYKIFGLPKSENWWGPPGDSGPCGPCSEIYYDYGEEYGLGDPLEDPKYGPGGDGGEQRFLEIWNLVFNQYEQLKEDRKSTRLNSSHANISYAVFCLKKKKISNVYTPFPPLDRMTS